MRVYRLGRTKHAQELTGEGARLNGGRWNQIGIPCLYTSESRALAVLEYTVNVNIDHIPKALSITTIEIPEDNIYAVPFKDLPGNWRASPAPASTKDFGSILLKGGKFAVIKIQSAVIPEEYNFLLNPVLFNKAAFEIIDVRDFVYDVRIKGV